MLSWLKKAIASRRRTPSIDAAVSFDSPLAALEFWGKLSDCSVRDGVGMPVVVVETTPDFATIKRPSDSGIVFGIAAFPSTKDDHQKYRGQLCWAIFSPTEVAEIGPAALIVATLDPAFSASKGWSVRESFKAR